MTGGTGEVKNTPYDGYLGPRLPRQVQLSRIRQVMQDELTPLQRETLMACYFEKKSQVEFARERGVSKSTVCRTLKRAERTLRRFLRY